MTHSRHGSRCCLRAASLKICAAVALLAVGCGQGDRSAVVKGLVMIDGAPLDRGVITFTADQPGAVAPAIGQILGGGAYSVQIGNSGELVSGEYTVTVASRAPSIKSPSGGPPTPGPLLTPKRYSNASTSSLRYFIRPGDNVIDIALSGDGSDEANEPPASGSSQPDARQAADPPTAADPLAEDPVDEASTDRGATLDETPDASPSSAD